MRIENKIIMQAKPIVLPFQFKRQQSRTSNLSMEIRPHFQSWKIFNGQI